nr:MAG TPA: protein of unknown function (DUF4972) [Caudoviricetes sp.]
MKKIIKIMLALTIAIMLVFTFGCSQADTMRNNIQKEANKFNVYRKITFVNLYTGQLLYSAEGYFSVQSTYENNYQGQQEIGLVFNVAKNEYKMDYFSIAENVCYVIEQLENTTGNPYYYKIVWYIAIPENVGG